MLKYGLNFCDMKSYNKILLVSILTLVCMLSYISNNDFPNVKLRCTKKKLHPVPHHIPSFEKLLKKFSIARGRNYMKMFRKINKLFMDPTNYWVFQHLYENMLKYPYRARSYLNNLREFYLLSRNKTSICNPENIIYLDIMCKNGFNKKTFWIGVCSKGGKGDERGDIYAKEDKVLDVFERVGRNISSTISANSYIGVPTEGYVCNKEPFFIAQLFNGKFRYWRGSRRSDIYDEIRTVKLDSPAFIGRKGDKWNFVYNLKTTNIIYDRILTPTERIMAPLFAFHSDEEQYLKNLYMKNIFFGYRNNKWFLNEDYKEVAEYEDIRYVSVGEKIYFYKKEDKWFYVYKSKALGPFKKDFFKDDTADKRAYSVSSYIIKKCYTLRDKGNLTMSKQILSISKGIKPQ